MVNIIIADDHPLFRSGMKSELEKLTKVNVVGEASDGMEAYHLIIEKRPDIAIIDIEMPTLTGIDVVRKISTEKSQTRCILMTMHKEKQYFTDALQAGAKGYLLKDNSISDLHACITSIQNNSTYYSDFFHAFITENEWKNEQNSGEPESWKNLLTPTELVILKLIGQSKTSSEIAALLFVSPHTIENHRSKISKKLNLDGSKNSLLKFALLHLKP